MSKAVQFTRQAFTFTVLFSLHSLINANSRTPQSKAPNSIHEADEQDLKVLAQIEYLQRQIASEINSCKSAGKSRELRQLFDELETIASEYTQLSPGTAFLGPFSSVSLVLKQREFKARIMEIEKLIRKA